MSMTLADRRNVPEVNGRPGRLVFSGKTAEAHAGEIVDLDEATGVVTAIVSVTGVVDEVDDIILPGAYGATLAKRNPKVCWAHSWEQPIGKVLDIKELLPGNPLLPSKTRDGKDWPKEAGALVASMQFNLRTEEGKKAFEVVRFYSDTGECEYSIGYQVPPGQARKTADGIRLIKALELYELSVVLFGAHTMTGTISVKDAAAAIPMSRAGVDLAHLMSSKAKPAFLKEKDEDAKPTEPAAEGEPAAKEEPEQAKPAEGTKPDFSDSVMVAVFPDPLAADAIANHIAGPDETTERDELHVTLAYLGKIADLPSEQEIIDTVTAAVEGQEALEGEVGGIGQFPAGDEGTPTWAPVDIPGLTLLREAVVGALGDLVFNDHGFTPHMTLGYDIGLIEPVPPTPMIVNAVHVVYGNSRREITLGTPVVQEKASAYTPDLDGVSTEGKALDYDPTLDTPEPFAGLSIDEVIRLTALDSLRARQAEEKAEGGADRNRGGAAELRRYWTTGEGGLKIAWGTPGDFTRCVSLLEEHMPGRAEGYCANRHKEMTGMWPGDSDNKDAVATDGAIETKGYPQLEGSMEARQQAVRQAICVQYEDRVDDRGYPNVFVDVIGTWDSTAVYALFDQQMNAEAEHFIVTYTVAEDGSIELGETNEADLYVTPIVRGDDDDEDDEAGVADGYPLVESVLSMATAMKAAHLVAEEKAGRVLSGANERALTAAIQHLVDVLAAAGVTVEGASPDKPRPSGNSGVPSDDRAAVDPAADLDTTSPEASRTKSAQQDDGVFVIDAAQMAADLAALGEI